MHIIYQIIGFLGQGIHFWGQNWYSVTLKVTDLHFDLQNLKKYCFWHYCWLNSPWKTWLSMLFRVLCRMSCNYLVYGTKITLVVLTSTEEKWKLEVKLEVKFEVNSFFFNMSCLVSFYGFLSMEIQNLMSIWRFEVTRGQNLFNDL